MKAFYNRIVTPIECRKRKIDWLMMFCVYFAGFIGGYVLALIAGLLR